MRIPTWRLVLTGAAITILAVAGIGIAAASNAPTTPAANPVAAADTPTAAPDTSPGKPGLGPRAQRLLRIGRHVVHVEATVTDKDGNLVNFQLDHGTVTSIGGGTLTISEAGGGSETISTSDATVVHVGRTKGTLSDVKVGVEVFVRSRVDGSTTTAKQILIVPAKS